MKTAVLQFDIKPGEIAENEAQAAHLIEQAAAAGAEMLVLPELWNCGYALADLTAIAQNMSGSSVKLLQKMAKKYGVFIIGGSIAEKKNGFFYNTSLAIDQNGDILQKYRKVHLFPLGIEEQKYFAAGDEWCLVDTPWGSLGMILCYDLRFGEFIRNLVLRGAQAIIVPAQWPVIRQKHWHVLQQARAIENAVYVVAANRIGGDSSGAYAGGSAIIDPWGKFLVQADENAGFWLADIDFAKNSEARELIPVLADRKAILDEIDNSLL